MGRRKVQIKRIENKSSRQVTFCKRRNGLIEKARQLSVLCESSVAVLVVSAIGKLYNSSSGDNRSGCSRGRCMVGAVGRREILKMGGIPRLAPCTTTTTTLSRPGLIIMRPKTLYCHLPQIGLTALLSEAAVEFLPPATALVDKPSFFTPKYQTKGKAVVDEEGEDEAAQAIPDDSQPHQLLPSDSSQYKLQELPPNATSRQQQHWRDQSIKTNNDMLHKIWAAISRIRPNLEEANVDGTKLMMEFLKTRREKEKLLMEENLVLASKVTEIWKQTFLVTRDETLMLPEYSFGDNTPETLSLLK
uniref:MADS-box domain-containing protein n=1 Tax=Brassica oleracea TaxID=3712 RepID=A0A3P6AMG8_BRAOL|nr:unnamed protein product [Brassica oleracea]